MSTVLVPSRDGTRIATRTAGDPRLPSLLFIHGWAQHMGCWDGIVDRLADRFHCVTLDMRGHGASDKPLETEAYTDSALWAEDVRRVIKHHDLTRPTLVGWSYGSRVIAAYLETFGGSELTGICLVGGILAIGDAREDWMLGADSPATNRDLYTNDLNRLIPATAAFVEACTTTPLPRRAYAELVAANMLCPAYVRRALFAANVDFRNVYKEMTCRGLVIHGTADGVVPARVGEAAAALMPNATYLPYDGIGHAPFLEDPDRFSQDLQAFATNQTEAAA